MVGYGTYGCGFRPALRCEGEATRRRGKFAKLVQQRTAIEEMELRNILVPRDPTREYFLYPEAICTPAAFQPSDGADNCKLKFTAENPARVIIMGKGGENLEKLTLRPRDYFPFFESLRRIFRGLAILNAAGLAHMDAKPPNIVTRRHRDGSFQTRLIDFGLMIDPTRLDAWADISGGTFDEYDVLDSNYLYWPFEVRLLKPGLIAAAVAQAGQIGAEFRRYHREQTQVRMSVPYELFSARKLSEDDAAAFAAPLAPMVPAARYATVIAKADVFGFGVSLAQIYYRFTGHRDGGGVAAPNIQMRATAGTAPTPVSALAPSVDLPAATVAWHLALAERVSIPLYTLVRAMTEPLPARRPSMEIALAVYEAILPRMAELLTPDHVSMAVKPWMLNAGVLIEGPSPVAGAAAGGAGAPAPMVSSSSEVPPSPVAPAPSAPPASPRMLAVAAAVRPNNAENNMVSVSLSSSSSNRSRRPELIPPGMQVSSDSIRRSSSGPKSSSNYNSSEERRLHEAYINRMLNGVNDDY
jgi:serine/threonine protein kinase